MKVALITLALVSLGCAAPQPRKLFHEHFQDFLIVIDDEVGDVIDNLVNQYMQYDDFTGAIQYMQTNSFRDLVAEMESLPEFKAVVEFLENDNIDIMFFIDLFHEILDSGFERPRRTSRQETSGTDVTAFVYDLIDLFPKEKLAALFDEKMAADEEFRVAMENLLSPEWDEVFSALWNNEVFQAEVKTLADVGIEVSVVLLEILAIFGQNKM